MDNPPDCTICLCRVGIVDPTLISLNAEYVMSSLKRPEKAYVPTEKQGVSVRKRQIEGCSLKRFVSTLAFNGHSPDTINMLCKAVFEVSVVVKGGKSTSTTVKQSTINMWCRTARKGFKDDGRTSRPESYWSLPEKLILATNRVLGGK